jgi:hypothetical protein
MGRRRQQPDRPNRPHDQIGFGGTIPGPQAADKGTLTSPNGTSSSEFSRFEVAHGKAVEGLKVQGQKSCGSQKICQAFCLPKLGEGLKNQWLAAF